MGTKDRQNHPVASRGTAPLGQALLVSVARVASLDRTKGSRKKGIGRGGLKKETTREKAPAGKIREGLYNGGLAEG